MQTYHREKLLIDNCQSVISCNAKQIYIYDLHGFKMLFLCIEIYPVIEKMELRLGGETTTLNYPRELSSAR